VTTSLQLDDIRSAAQRIQPYINHTPLYHWQDDWVDEHVSGGELHLKLEFLQRTGSFKARGAVNNILTRDNAEREKALRPSVPETTPSPLPMPLGRSVSRPRS